MKRSTETGDESARTLVVRARAAIGPSRTPYVIAEIGTNHNQSLDTAKHLLCELAGTGCDCAKFQIYEPEEIVSARVRASDYGLDGLYGDISAREMFDRYLKTPKAWFPELREMCHTLGMDFAATIHGARGLRWALDVGVDVVKIASMDHGSVPFLRSLVNVVDAPILVSVGMAGISDIDTVVAVTAEHKRGVGLFHCCAVYPPEPNEIRLPNIPFLIQRFSIPVGFSDHSIGLEATLEARDVGAMMFEKHVTLDRTQRGPDHPFAMEMVPFREYIAAVKRRTTTRAATSGTFLEPSQRELQNRRMFVKSIISRRAMVAGHVLSAEDVYFARPGTGISPADTTRLLGRLLIRPVAEEVPLQWEDVESQK